jgi:hypothetical protein
VGARVVRVYGVRVPGAQDRAHATCGCQIPVSAHAHGGGGDTRRAQASDERRVRGRDHERLVTLLTLSAREQVYLPLSAAPFSAGIQVEDAKRARIHPRTMDAAGGRRNGTAIGPQLGGPNVGRAVAALLALEAPECRVVFTTISRTTRTIPSSKGKGVER